ncbi:MAG: hypothetical protein ABEJ86_01130 [Halococcoides sp.]
MADRLSPVHFVWLGPADADPPSSATIVDGRPDADENRMGASASAAVGRAGLRRAIESGFDSILAVDPPGSVPGVDPDDVGAALEVLRAGQWSLCRAPIASVRLPNDRVRAVLDVAVVADKPDSVATVTIRSDGRTVDRVRADGVVVATPYGSSGYARSAGGPLLVDDDSLAVVPMGPFETDPGQWVLDGPVSISVDGPATVVADGESVAELPGDTALDVAIDDSIGLIVPDLTRVSDDG